MAPLSVLCPICQCPLQPQEPATACPECRTQYHYDCWQENKGCAIYGCSQVPPTETYSPLEIPPAYWGQEHRPCPACGAQILAAAIRCRHCGATFPSGQLEDPQTYQQRIQLQNRLPGLCKAVIWHFILSVIPCTSPVGALVGGLWRVVHRAELRSLPPIHAALSRLALLIGTGQTLLLLFMVLLFHLLRSP
ncbi:MAG: hypothetical protein NZ602_01420 [Thermoguttaceae bacterium]|nr:hypothetical protein [Thermoguttaceae bacterium]MDW8037211.1 RING finger protein [Thermoguttaceae bacterium]